MTELEQKLHKWKMVKSRGDVMELAKLAKVSTVTICTAMRNGNVGEEIMQVIEDFYIKRIKEVKNII